MMAREAAPGGLFTARASIMTDFIEALSPGAQRVLDPQARLERVATGFVFTEGPLWDARTRSLLFSDIPANRIYRWTEAGGATVFREPSGKSNGLAWDREGALLACEHARRRVSRTLAGGRVVPLAERYGGRRLNSPNDLVVRSDGSLYFTDPPYGLTAEFGEPGEPEQPVNGLYRLPPAEETRTGEPVLVADDFDRPNGLAFSPDEQRLYVADTPRYHVRVFDVRADGTLAGGAVCAQFREDHGVGRPDGMKVDAEGNLYTTGPGGVWIMDPDATLIAHLHFPEKTANLAWGDDDLRSLYVTATSSLYRLRTLVPGNPQIKAPGT
jgi:gluconolactonase